MKQSKSKKIIAITGGIGSGKTIVSGFLQSAGYKVVSCDKITAELYKKRKIKKQIAKLFPAAAKGRLLLRVDKTVVAKECFENAEKLKRLNEFLHPIIISEALTRAKAGGGNVAFVEIPLLFETDSAKYFDKVIVVKRSVKERIKAVCERSALTEEEVLKRINAQFDYDKSDLSGNVVIENDGDLSALSTKTFEVIKNI